MDQIPKDFVKAYQEWTFRLNSEESIKTFEQAVDFIKERGYLFLWPVKGIHFPSLWSAVAGDRPVPNIHDDPGHVTWRWKDSALGMRVWYYAKVLRNKATFISLEVLPYFYALSDNYGSPKEDYLIAYHDGHLTHLEKILYETILSNGPMHTIDLKQIAIENGVNSESLFSSALAKLQSDFRIVPAGIAEVGSWKYAFIYDLTSNQFPELEEKARLISVQTARRKLAELYFLSMGASDEKNFRRLFRWDIETTRHILGSMIQDGLLKKSRNSKTEDLDWFSLPSIDG